MSEVIRSNDKSRCSKASNVVPENASFRAEFSSAYRSVALAIPSKRFQRKAIRNAKSFIAHAEELFQWTVTMDNWLRSKCQRAIVAEYLDCLTLTKG